jgi:glycosyltransferase involved in cell wall biosynthesis
MDSVDIVAWLYHGGGLELYRELYLEQLKMKVLVFPVDMKWPEPFGLAMIEAMACGTPVLAFNHGSVPEIIDPGVTGAIVNSVDEAVRMLPHVLALDRGAVRRRFEQRFTARRMAEDYLKTYRALIERSMANEPPTRLVPAMLEEGLN